ncbi:ferritin-like domain-containing protein [Rhodococcus koreensis]
MPRRAEWPLRDNALLQGQIRNEFNASHQCAATAVSFDNSDVPRLARHVHKLSVEERNHAMMVVQYFLDRDFSVELSGVDAGKSTPWDITPIGRGTVRRSRWALRGAGSGYELEPGADPTVQMWIRITEGEALLLEGGEPFRPGDVFETGVDSVDVDSEDVADCGVGDPGRGAVMGLRPLTNFLVVGGEMRVSGHDIDPAVSL